MIRTILIIDDEPADRLIARRVLKKAGLEATIHELANGQAALDFLEQFGSAHDAPQLHPSVLALVDINMPHLGGFEFLEQLEEMLRIKQMHSDWIAVMMFSSSANQRDRTRAERHAVVRGYIVKPLTVESVQDLVARLG